MGRQSGPEILPEEMTRFAKVVEHGGFSGAARATGLPRQALHKSIANLESRFGVRLLERTTRSIRLTDTGRTLLVRAEAVSRELAAANAELTDATGRPRGRLRMTAPHLFAETFLADVLASFLARHPDVELDVDLSVARRDFAKDELDLAVRLGSRPEGDLVAFELARPRVRLCAAPAFLARHTVASLTDLERVPAVVYGGARRATWRFEDAPPVTPRPRLRVESAPLALRAAQAGIGLTLLADYVVRPALERGALVEVLPRHTPQVASAWVIHPRGVRARPALAALVDDLRAVAARELGGGRAGALRAPRAAAR